ncbi:uncharacterized protein LOC143080461 isoform X2 [Mytilus galloprovincialis]|uniref:uncharacterized protein LOC143080461 isoform X2 n=1 Tax=Mytilus galloprovincialis TaxID=29158 RepID=UPI003F7B3E41
MLSVKILILVVSTVYAEWPTGTYTLVKPKTGCPTGWKEGSRRQDTENHRNRNFITPGHHFYGKFGIDMEFHYCTKDAHAISGTQHWPVGNYCILRQGISCPSGFKTGSIYWDDEDHHNSNEKEGILPSGVFDTNTLIFYCCRFDGSYRTPINLPPTIPFYLLRYRSPCQQVQGMVAREEVVMFDDEDTQNGNLENGSHPLNHRSTVGNTLYYCYYD